jgi:hypothetical protein
MVSDLRAAYQQGDLSRVTRKDEMDEQLDTLMAKPWVVFAKPCLQGAKSVIDYLGRYTHRIALSDSRLIHMDERTVSFQYRDYRDNQKKIMSLDGGEFLRRFLQHVLPKGFMRVRHFGWLANASRGKRLPAIRKAIAAHDQKTNQAVIKPQTISTAPFTGIACPCCKESLMHIYAQLKPQRLEGG